MPSMDPTFAVHKLNVDPSRRPVVQKVRRSSIAHVEAVMAEVDQLLEAGVIREVLYPSWLANPVVVPKKNGKLRVCVDYTNLNDACPMDRFPLPRIEQMVDATVGCERLSFMDAYRGYHQIALAPEDQEKTAFISPRGTYCYKVVPFGLKNAGATFQRSITKMFPGMLGRILEAYIDDLVCKSMFARDHLRDLGEVFAVLKQRKLRLNAEKCAFGVSSGKFLGYMALQSLKQYLSNAPLLVKALPDEDLYLYLAVSDHATSAVLVRKEGMEHQPIFYSSKTMTDSQTRAGAGIVLVSPSGMVHESAVSIGYPATNNKAEYEALIVGLQLALRLDVDSAHIFCDSQLIVGHLNDDYQVKDQRMNAYVSHVLALLRRFGRVEVEWITREHNAHADTLAGLGSVYRTSGSRTITFDEVTTPSFEHSCQPVMTISLGPSQLDPVIDYLKNQVLPPNKREAYKLRCRAANFFLGPNDNLYRRTFTGPDLCVVHEDHVTTVLEELHSGSCGAHSGGRSLTQRALTQGYWWPKMVK
ncbi:uncharacterized protein LOC131327440 [Rhododendron vialii]|uniref:uncharacterized protein LOC131327440 n=1 Tax=Rhododendron vialii TaxID=182163 RepID=UPI00265EA9C2|nr:uncharacterized protein LOC131327440 [Rhododendron vialii]